ncbi:alkylation response protein AidB-like acyl-CoA dehydrogenase [Deinobacterium chartae]|uniref:Alkylation response protein AidB-like acyl-CoA dehydrogenase n=1 Tax=Deinobacterium chartae TaxID=521158 RepID=A0A841HXM9_9DEIO|nr:acyl-CoA dehydrogenase family protein [Deinobacterium chartae]MBB6097404.1 alkylation response protein AidB-like acyl-CoA dehydrogenase [Deinobacterium chartae]
MLHSDSDALLEAARAVAGRFAARAQSADSEARLPPEDLADLRNSGLLRLALPEEQGGRSLSVVLEVVTELARGSTSSALVAAMHLQTLGHARDTGAWNAAAYAQLVGQAQAGALMNVCASEPELGSPSRGGLPRTRAVRLPDGRLRLEGRKTWTSGGPHLTQLLVNLDLEGRAALVRVESGRTGVRWENTWQHALGLRGSQSWDLILEGVEVGSDAVVSLPADAGQPAARNVWFPLLMGAVYLGAALGARDDLAVYARQRIPTALGAPIATLPKIRRWVGEIEVELLSARALLREVAAAWSAGSAETREGLYPAVAAAKYRATEAAVRATDLALRAAGGAAFSGSLTLERRFRDVRAGLAQPPADDTALEIVGRAVLDASG